MLEKTRIPRKFHPPFALSLSKGVPIILSLSKDLSLSKGVPIVLSLPNNETHPRKTSP